jgi:hypothetical protein
MAFRVNSKARRVTDYLSEGKTLTAAEAKARFGVKNFRATISHIKGTVEAYGNHEITCEPTATSTARYGMVSYN